ncbi:hypothetical protein DPMN_113657 [Dreissena polymorpha]|uniref:Uncharacterized protein n=1 Tax=Dreissena polymorpha TaxID=45954 RepID=A0A9D4QRR3_DREPO|nr:hypothetical protein DPMN_113657 [Dreissena polymorpha]
MNDYVGHSFIKLPGDIGDLSWHSVVSQKSPEGRPVNAAERLFIDMKLSFIVKFNSGIVLVWNNGLRSDPCPISPFESLRVGHENAGLLRLSSV